jgi:hypothetical protein
MRADSANDARKDTRIRLCQLPTTRVVVSGHLVWIQRVGCKGRVVQVDF